MKQFSGFESLPTGKANDNITKACLVLEGGAFRGVYTSGVCDALMEAAINCETVIGVSAGAMIGACCVSGDIGRAARVNLGHRHDPEYIGPKTLLRDKGVIGFKYALVDSMEEYPFDMERFKSYKQRFIAVATEVETAKPHYFENGKCKNIFKAIKASASMQFFSRPVDVNGCLCLDGGPADHFPFQWAIDEGYDKIILVRTRDRTFRYKSEIMNFAYKFYKKYPEYADLVAHYRFTYNDWCERAEEAEREGKLFMISPEQPITVSRLESDMEKLGDLYYTGYNQAKEIMSELKLYLGM